MKEEEEGKRKTEKSRSMRRRRTFLLPFRLDNNDFLVFHFVSVLGSAKIEETKGGDFS